LVWQFNTLVFKRPEKRKTFPDRALLNKPSAARSLTIALILLFSEVLMMAVNRKISRSLVNQMAPTERRFRMRTFADSYVLSVLLAKPELGATGRWRGGIQAGAQRLQNWKHSSRAA